VKHKSPKVDMLQNWVKQLITKNQLQNENREHEDKLWGVREFTIKELISKDNDLV